MPGKCNRRPFHPKNTGLNYPVYINPCFHFKIVIFTKRNKERFEKRKLKSYPRKMKAIKQFLLFAAVATFLTTSCSLQKRTYMPGYHIEWKKNQHNKLKQELVKSNKNNEAKSGFEDLIIPNLKIEISETTLIENA